MYNNIMGIYRDVCTSALYLDMLALVFALWCSYVWIGLGNFFVGLLYMMCCFCKCALSLEMQDMVFL